ncbi:hypothetical protein GCM10027035_33810 [Emticicia sediminis]
MKTPFFISLFLIAFEGFSQKIASITLNESTRGFRREIIITEKEYVLAENSIISKRKLSAEDWKEIMKICAKIKLEELPNFKSPSQKRANDAALQANIEVLTGRRKYQSSTFDHDNPPKELVKLVNKLRNL